MQVGCQFHVSGSQHPKKAITSCIWCSVGPRASLGVVTKTNVSEDYSLRGCDAIYPGRQGRRYHTITWRQQFPLTSVPYQTKRHWSRLRSTRLTAYDQRGWGSLERRSWSLLVSHNVLTEEEVAEFRKIVTSWSWEDCLTLKNYFRGYFEAWKALWSGVRLPVEITLKVVTHQHFNFTNKVILWKQSRYWTATRRTCSIAL
jgi:hypothetical protein